MAFALSKVRAYGNEAEEPVNKRYKQTLLLNITGLAADVDLDIGDFSGTFWTAVGATGVGPTALSAVKSIQKSAESFVAWGATSIGGFIKVLTPSAPGHYSIAMDGTNTQLPNFAFFAANAPTSYVLYLEWVLKDSEVPVEVVAST